MPNYNKCEIIGHVGQEPSMRFLPNGTPVTNITVAVNREYTTTSGEKKKDTQWFNVVAYRKLAESINQYIVKGSLVFVSGRVGLHRWTGNDNIEKSNLQIDASTVVFLTSKEKNTTESIPDSQDDKTEYYEDIPF
jgi:single-strand DNA-binding protein